jgi:5-methylcytosine-specific restriction endonuclease McrA
MKNCKRCEKKLVGKQTSYCSPRCSRLHLKSLYRKRYRDRINEYNKANRKLGIHGHPSTNKTINEFRQRNNLCAKCGTTDNLNVCHIKPRKSGGKNKDNLIVLCQKHHYQFDHILENFWGIGKINN